MANWTVLQGKAAAVNTGFNSSHASLTTAAPAITTTPGSSLIAVVWGYDLDGASITITDSASNTYSLDVQSIPSARTTNDMGLAIFSSHNTASVSHSGGSFTASISSSWTNSNWGLYVVEAAPPTGVGALDTNAAGTSGTSSSPSAGPSGTVTGGPELYLFAATFDDSAATLNPSTNGAWTADGHDTDNPGDSLEFSIAVAHQTPASPSGTVTANPITDPNSITASNCCLAIYKIAGYIPPSPVAPTRGGKSQYLANAIANHELGKASYTMPSAIYLALCSVIPGTHDTGSTITEVNYTGYARVAIPAASLNSAVGGSVANNTPITFPQNTGSPVTAYGWCICDASSAGNMLLFSGFPGATPTFAIGTGATPTLAAGQFVVVET